MNTVFGDNMVFPQTALKTGAQQIVQLIVPVTICMAIVVLFELTVAVNDPITYASV